MTDVPYMWGADVATLIRFERDCELFGRGTYELPRRYSGYAEVTAPYTPLSVD